MRRTYLHVNGAVGDFLFAARLKTPRRQVVATQCLRSPGPNVHYSACLASNIEQMFATGAAPYPVERTLLVGGIIEKGLASLHAGGALMQTPELARVQYTVGPESLHTRA